MQQPKQSSTDDPFVLRLIGAHRDAGAMRWLSSFLQGMAVGLLLVVLCLLISQHHN